MKSVRWCFFLFIFTGFYFSSFSQNEEKALISLLDSVTGNEKIMILNRLSDAVLYKSPQKSLEYGIEALNLAKVDTNKQMIAESYLSVAYALRYTGEYKKALDSLYITIGFINQLTDKRLQSQILNLTGLIHQDLGHDTLSLDNYFKSFDLSKEINDNYGMISTLNNLGNFYMNNGNYQKSTEYFFKCLKVYEQVNNEKGAAQMYNNIGTVYQRQGNFNKALEYHLKAYEIIIKYPDYKIGQAYVYNNLGASYINIKDYNKAVEYLLKSINICSDLGLHEYILANYNNLGIVYKELKEYDKAIDYLLEGLKLADKTKNKVSTSKYLLNIADVYLVENKYDRALSYFTRALVYNIELNDFFLLSENNYGIYEVYKAKGDYQKALVYLEQYLNYRDSLDVVNNSKLTAEIEAQYELDKKEQRISTLQKDSRIQELELDRKRINNKILLYGITALGVIIALISVFFLQRIRVNRILKEQNRQINQQNEELNFINDKLKKSEKELQESNQTKDKFFSIIAHDLKNPLVALKSMVYSLGNKKESFTENDLDFITTQLKESLNSIINLLNNLLHWARTQKNQIVYSEEEVNVFQLVNMVTDSLKENAQNKDITIRNNISLDNFFLKTDKNMLEFIIRNILSNAIKYSNKKNYIDISADCNDYFYLKIQDYGIGISNEKVSEIFANKKLVSTQGTSGEQGTGLGLALSNEFINMMNGTLTVNSEKDKGSAFTITLPIK